MCRGESVHTAGGDNSYLTVSPGRIIQCDTQFNRLRAIRESEGANGEEKHLPVWREKMRDALEMSSASELS